MAGSDKYGVSSQLADTVVATEVVLTKLRKRMGMLLGSTSLESMDFRVSEPVELFGQKLYEAAFDVLSDKIAEDTYTTRFTWKTPKTAWQMLKKQHAPKWFTRRYPVQYEHHTYKRLVKFTRFAEYPKANIAIPKDNDRLFIQTLGGLEVIRDEVRDVN